MMASKATITIETRILWARKNLTLFIQVIINYSAPVLKLILQYDIGTNTINRKFIKREGFTNGEETV